MVMIKARISDWLGAKLLSVDWMGGRTECNDSTKKVKMKELQESTPFLERKPWDLYNLTFSEPSEWEDKKAGVKRSGAKIGGHANKVQSGKVNIFSKEIVNKIINKYGG